MDEKLKEAMKQFLIAYANVQGFDAYYRIWPGAYGINVLVNRATYKRGSLPNTFMGYLVQKVYTKSPTNYKKVKKNSLTGRRTFINGCTVNEAKKFLKQFAKKIRIAGSGTVEVIWKPGQNYKCWQALRDLQTYIKIKEC